MRRAPVLRGDDGLEARLIFFVEIHGYGLLSDPFDVTDTARDEPLPGSSLGVEPDAEDVGRTITPARTHRADVRDNHTIAAVDGFDAVLRRMTAARGL